MRRGFLAGLLIRDELRHLEAGLMLECTSAYRPGTKRDLATATGAEDVPLLKIRRLSLVNIGMLAGILVALAIAIPSLKGIDWNSVQGEFENADWGWVFPRVGPLSARAGGWPEATGRSMPRPTSPPSATSLSWSSRP